MKEKQTNKLTIIQAHWQAELPADYPLYLPGYSNPANSNPVTFNNKDGDIPDLNAYLLTPSGPLLEGIKEGKANCFIQINWFAQGGSDIAKILGTEPTQQCKTPPRTTYDFVCANAGTCACT